MRILLDEASLAGTRPGTSRSERSPTRTTRCCRRRWRNGRWHGSRRCCRGIWKSSTKSTGAFWTMSRRDFPDDEGRVERVSLIEEGAANARCAWRTWPSSARTAPTAWRQFIPSSAQDHGQGPGGDVPGALQQQDQRRHAAPLAVALRIPRSPQRSPRPSATAGSPIWARLRRI